jgi:hypothetical protein
MLKMIFLKKGEGPEIPSNLLPNTGQETIKFEERWQRAKDEVEIMLHSELEADVLDEEGRKKYMTKNDPENHENDFCTCPDASFRNKPDYIKTHGVAYICKHQMRLIQHQIAMKTPGVAD